MSGDGLLSVLSIKEKTLEDTTWGDDGEEIITETKALFFGVV